jgi:hypothetical protein
LVFFVVEEYSFRQAAGKTHRLARRACKGHNARRGVVAQSMLNAIRFLALACCGLFAGAALYINIVEHPARMSCGADIALREWVPSYERATFMQAPLALLGGAAGVLAWAFGARVSYLTGGLLLLAVVPFTLFVIYPTNKLLLELHAQSKVDNAPALLERWNRLHGVRTMLSVVAFVIMLLAAIW